MARRFLVSVVFLLATLVGAGTASAAGGNYVFAGGTQAEQAQVRNALNASTFNWSLVPAQITIHIARGIPVSEASPGQIWLDANLLDSGSFSWGVVQHEYAHEVDYFLLDDAKRASLEQPLGGRSWFYDTPGLPHAAYGCERFASTLAWTYWQSADNVMRPQSPADESAAMAPAKFRALLAQVLALPQAATAAPIEVAHAPALPKRHNGR